MFYPTKKYKVSLRGIMTLLACFIFFSIQAQSDREFWFAAPEVTSDHSDKPVFFRVTAYSKDATVTISQPANPSFLPIVFTVFANQTYSFDFTSYLPIIENKPGNTVLNYGILITSTTSISAYYELASSNNPEIFPLKGNVSKGVDFLIPAQTRFNNQIYTAFPAHNGFAIIATEDNTQVDITLTNKDEAGHLPGATYSIILNKGQTYAVNAASASVSTHIGGSVVKSNKPICVTIYDDSIVIGGWDLIGDQIVPINSTGKKFIVVKGVLNFTPNFPLTDFIYIWPTEDNTEISINGTALTTKYNKGKSYELLLSDPTAFITTDKPVYVFQLTGTGTEAAATSLPSIECTGSQSVSFVRPYATEFYLNLFCKTEDIGSFLINGNAGLINATMFSPVNGTSNVWQYARISVSSIPALNNLISTTTATSITNGTGLFHLGFLNTSSGGSRLGYFSNYAQVALVPVIASTSCFGSDIQLQATDLLNVKYKWTGPNNFVDSVSNPIIKNAKFVDSGMYVVVANINGCGLSMDSVYVKVNPKPTIHFLKSLDTVCYGSAKNIAFSLNGKAPWTVAYTNGTQNDTLKAISQSPSYFTKSPTINTIYSILNIKDSNSCVVDVNYSSEKDTLIVNPLPIANFDISKIRCEKNTIIFSDSSKAFLDTLTRWYWDLGNGKIRNEISKIPFKDTLLTWGNYTMKLAVESSMGCKSDTLIKTSFINSLPNINFSKPEICLKDAFGQFNDSTTNADGVTLKNWNWNFGDKYATLLYPNTSTQQNPKHKYDTSGMYYVTLKVVSNASCENTLVDSFYVNGAVPKAQFRVINDSFLCHNQSVKIIDSSWVDFGTIGKLQINWGDGSADSVVDDPVINKGYQHFYKNISAPSNLKLNYTIKVKAFSGGACYIDTTNAIHIVAPPETPIIQTDKNELCIMDSLILNTTTKGGVGPFSYSYTSDNALASIFQNRIKGISYGKASVSVKVTDSKNCVYPFDNAFSITAIDIPIATISAKDTVICNGDSVQMYGTGTNAIKYKWYRNDTLVYTTSIDSIRHNIPGMYSLIVNDGKCNSLVSSSIKISPLDITQYGFSYNSTVCVGVPIKITTDAKDQYNVHYRWEFGDGFYFSKANPVEHKYVANGNFTIKLNVTNDYCPKYYYQVIGKTLKVISPIQPIFYKLYLMAYQDTILPTKMDPGYVKYNWSPITFLSSNNIPFPNFKGDKSIDYILTRTDTVTGCSVADEYELIVSPDVYVNLPNAFTPNGDGLNDILKVEYGAGVTGSFTFKIFNRWGKMVFQTNDITQGWNGRDTNGVMQETDGYSYYLEYQYKNYKTGDVIPVKKTGSFILFR